MKKLLIIAIIAITITTITPVFAADNEINVKIFTQTGCAY